MDPWMSSNRKKPEGYFVDKWFYLLSSRQHFEDYLQGGISMPKIIYIHTHYSSVLKLKYIKLLNFRDC